MNAIKVVVCRVGCDPVVEEIRQSLESFQMIVGGFIQHVHIYRDIWICCNEEGRNNGLKPNRCGVLGDFFFFHLNADGQEDSLSDADVAKAMEFCCTGPH